MTLRRYQSGSNLPDLLAAVPWWYPGTWGPPAFTVSLVSAAMTAFAAWFLFRNELVKAMFRFPFDSLWVAIPAMGLAGVIVWRASLRPGKLWPRLWALILAAFCTFVTLWTLYVKATPQKDAPRLHALAAIGALAALTLTPRLFHVHPFSVWVRHAAPAALAFVVLLCFPLIFLSENVVVAKERQVLDTKAEGLERASRNISGIVHARITKPTPFSYEQASPQKLQDVSFKEFLPDEADWKALDLLQRETGVAYQERMRKAMAGLIEVLVDGAENSDAPNLSEAPIYADGVSENNDSRWRENRRFPGEAAAAGSYYHELGRMFRDFDHSGRTSPFRSDYQSQQDDLRNNLSQRADLMGQLWIQDVFDGRMDPVDTQRLTSSHVGDPKYSLGDLYRWKNLSLQDAREHFLDKPGCLHEVQKLQRYEIVRIEDPNEPNGYRDERLLRQYQRIECYAYRPGKEGNRPEVLAELHLTYRVYPYSNTPHSVALLFDVPPKASHYREDLMQALADRIQEMYGVTPTPPSLYSASRSNRRSFCSSKTPMLVSCLLLDVAGKNSPVTCAG